MKSLGVEVGDKVELLELFRNLGYEDDEIFEDVTINHPLTRISFDYGIVKYGEDCYGMIVCVKDVCDENVEKLVGMCKLVGARYGVLTDFNEICVVRVEGFKHEFVDEIPQSYALKMELGLLDVCAIAIDYDEFEKVDDVDFVVENSNVVYSDVENEEAIIFSPNGKLLDWLRRKGIRFKVLDEERLRKIVSKYFLNLNEQI